MKCFIIAFLLCVICVLVGVTCVDQRGEKENIPNDSMCGSREEYTRVLKEWITVPMPKFEEGVKEAAWYAANYSNHEWEVYLDDGIICAREYNPKKEIIGEKPQFKIPDSKQARGRKYTLHATDGWLIGYNAGEWGGSLWRFSEDGAKKYKISDDQINGFLQTSHGIYGLEGLAHLGISKGGIVKIIKNKKTNRWGSELFAKLHEAPDAVALDKDGSMIVVTTSGLVRVSSVGKVEILVKDTDWWGFYPNSIVLDSSGTAYIGMRQGVAKISLTPPSPTEWLIPSMKILEDDLAKVKQIRE